MQVMGDYVLCLTCGLLIQEDDREWDDDHFCKGHAVQKFDSPVLEVDDDGDDYEIVAAGQYKP